MIQKRCIFPQLLLLLFFHFLTFPPACLWAQEETPQKQDSKQISLEEIITLNEMGLSAEEILEALYKTKSKYPAVTVEELEVLKQKGVPKKVIHFILSTRKGPLFKLEEISQKLKRGATSLEILQKIKAFGIRIKLSALDLLKWVDRIPPSILYALRHKPIGIREVLFMQKKKVTPEEMIQVIQMVGWKEPLGPAEKKRLQDAKVSPTVISYLFPTAKIQKTPSSGEKPTDSASSPNSQKKVSPKETPQKETDIQKYTKFIQIGKKHLKMENWQQAYQAFQKALFYMPRSSYALSAQSLCLVELGHARMKSQNFSRALDLANKAVQLNPNSIDGYLCKARALLSLGKQKLARQVLEKAKHLDSKNPEVYTLFGSLEFLRTNYTISLHWIQKALQADPFYVPAYIDMGVIYGIHWQKYNKGLHYLNRALKLNPFFLNAYFYRAMIYLKEGKWNDALQDLNEVLERDGKYDIARYYRVFVWVRKRNIKNALGDLGFLIQRHPDSSRLYLKRAQIFLMTKKFKKALKDLNQCIQINPKMDEAYRVRGILYFNMGKEEKAIQDWKRFLSLNPSHRESRRIRKIIQDWEKKQKKSSSPKKEKKEQSLPEEKKPVKEDF